MLHKNSIGQRNEIEKCCNRVQSFYLNCYFRYYYQVSVVLLLHISIFVKHILKLYKRKYIDRFYKQKIIFNSSSYILYVVSIVIGYGRTVTNKKLRRFFNSFSFESTFLNFLFDPRINIRKLFNLYINQEFYKITCIRISTYYFHNYPRLISNNFP